MGVRLSIGYALVSLAWAAFVVAVLQAFAWRGEAAGSVAAMMTAGLGWMLSLSHVRNVLGASPEATRALAFARDGREVARAPLPSLRRALLFDNLAYARALEGRAEDALAAAENARATCPAYADVRTRRRILATLGVARVRAGQYDAGVSLLAAVIDAGGTRPEQAAHAFFMGEGLRAMGRVLEAREAWARGVRQAPASEWGRRAAERLAMQPASPFR